MPAFEPVFGAVVHDDALHPAIDRHVPESIIWIDGVQRDVGRAGFVGTQDRHDQRYGAFHAQTHAIAELDAERMKAKRKSIRRVVQLLVGQLHLATAHGCFGGIALYDPGTRFFEAHAENSTAHVWAESRLIQQCVGAAGSVLSGGTECFSDALRCYVAPHLVYVLQTFFLRASFSFLSPSKRKRPKRRPDRVLLLIIDNDGVLQLFHMFVPS